MGLKDKVAIITGAGRGIGRAYALRFADEGAKVVIADIIFENAQKVAKEIEGKGGQALALRSDVSDEASTVEMARKAAERFGGIDILINNAAIMVEFGLRPWDSWSTADLDLAYAINVRGSWLCAKAVVPFMISGGKGKIINIASDTADIGFDRLLPYTLSKGAVVTLTRILANALGRHNINVNAICPGYTLSEANLKILANKPPGFDEILPRLRLLKRHEYPEDLVGTAEFLACEDSDFITGQTIVVNGGMVLH